MEKLAILGAGTMGHSIALNAAWQGIDLTLYGVNKEDIERGHKGIIEKTKTLLQHGLIQENEAGAIIDRITMVTSIEEAVGNATFIIEAVPENIDLKKSLFKQLDSTCGSDVVLASNTSGLSPTLIASATSRPERVVVMHFWNPAHLIPLVEVVRGTETNDTTVLRAMNLLKQMKKKAIEVKKEMPGFVANRLQFALFREAQYLLEEGVATKEDIDAAVTYSIGRRLPVTGPLLSADMGGLDVFAAISDYLFATLSNADASLPTLKKLAENNKFGNKSGEGYYDWNADFSVEMNHKRETELIRFLKQDLARG